MKSEKYWFKYKCQLLYLEYSILFEDYIEWKWHILCWFKTFCPRIYEIWTKLFSSNAEVPFILTENRSNFLQPHCRPQRDSGNIQIMQNSRINLHLCSVVTGNLNYNGCEILFIVPGNFFCLVTHQSYCQTSVQDKCPNSKWTSQLLMILFKGKFILTKDP